ncbi:fatty acid desaturase 2-like protein FADS2P1 isoform X2 [Fukomys damarensis]|uniref:fatty acid desaturase 2-like protein FADS2P1 isoform X2 n=1 Tax=Fukomys damarensis TaxID=885580 RepID=UPI00053F325F|nr:fatty acid desaturase 2-like protein FADS2P1 isoform X2 [Fukomys damarensis]
MRLEEKLEKNGHVGGRPERCLSEAPQENQKPRANGKAACPAKQEANGKLDMPGRSLNVYTWQEVQRHRQEGDQWLVINRKVYDVSQWASRHPGGSRVLSHCAGEDATPQLVEDFRELRRTLEALNMFEANVGFFLLHLAQILVLEALAWLILCRFGNGWTVTVFISVLLTVSQAQSSFLQHDLGHLTMFKKSTWNHVMHKLVMCHLKGMSTNWWNYRHFQHHIKPNIYPKDPDIDAGPLFLLGESQPVKYGKKKIRFINYEKQHLYFYMVGLPFLMPAYFNGQSMQVMYLRKYWADIVFVSSFYIRHFITFGPFYGIFGTLMLIYLVKFLESPWIAYVTQMSHIPMRMSKEENRDWLSTQVLATCNVEQSFFNDWFTGHLNFQIEHHLFPTMPCHNYHKVAPLVRSLCAKHGLQYVNKPMLTAFGDIVRALKRSAALWMDAYYE